MRIKRFFAPNMRLALRDVRSEQGPDAVILSNRRVDGGIEVVAAVDYDESLLQPASAAASAPVLPPTSAEAETPAGTPEVAAGAAFEAELPAQLLDGEGDTADEPKSAPASAPGHEPADPTLALMRNDMRNMRTMLEDQLACLAWNETTRRDPVGAGILRELAAAGFAPALAREVARRASAAAASKPGSSALQTARELLASAVPVVDDTLLDEGGVVAVVGPTGVGKTTSIAKIAARFALRHGRDQVALVSMDGFRIGAQEQLATFAQILDVPVHLVGIEERLSDVLAGLRDKRLVLIDTAGISQRDAELPRHLAAFRGADDAVRIYLALAANAQNEAQEEAVREFGREGIDGCILTKLDEAGSLGGAISALVAARLPLAWLTDGQRVPEDLHGATNKALWLVHRAVRLARDAKRHTDEDTMARQFGEVQAHAFA